MGVQEWWASLRDADDDEFGGRERPAPVERDDLDASPRDMLVKIVRVIVGGVLIVGVLIWLVFHFMIGGGGGSKSSAPPASGASGSSGYGDDDVHSTEAAGWESAKVVRWIDGDTLVVTPSRTIRLVQVDAPERGKECGAIGSWKAAMALAPPGSKVRWETDSHLDQVDRYGRTLAYVVASGGDGTVQEALVDLGYAAPYFYRGRRGRMGRDLEDSAALARVRRDGVWGACPDAFDDTDWSTGWASGRS